MSDFPPSPGPPPGNQPPAPGYWQASDGNWYPPESHPDATPTATGQGASPRTIVYANFGQRLGAFLLDGLIIGVPAAIIFFGVLSAVPTEIVLCDEGLCEQPTGSGFAILFLVGLAMLVFVVWFWWGKLIGETGQTPGRKATASGWSAGTQASRSGWARASAGASWATCRVRCATSATCGCCGTTTARLGTTRWSTRSSCGPELWQPSPTSTASTLVRRSLRARRLAICALSAG